MQRSSSSIPEVPHLLSIGDRLSGLLRKDPTTSHGGAEIQHAMMARELAARGWRVDVCSDGDLADMDWDGGRIWHIKGSGLKPSRLWNIYKVFKRSHARAVMIVGVSAFIFVFYLFCRIRGKKIILGIQHDLDVVPDMRIKGWRRLVYLWTLKRIDLLLVQHNVQRQHAERLVRCPIIVIPNYLLISASPSQPPLGEAFIWLGTFRSYKRPEIVLELAKALPQFKFLLVCKPLPPEALKVDDHRKIAYESMQKRAAELPNVRFIPGCGREEIQSLILESKALLITSEGEGWPNVLLEVAAYGRGVLAFHDVGEDIIQKKGIGKVAGTVEEAISALGETTEEQWQLFGQNALRYVQGECSNTAITERLSNEILALLHL